MNFFDAVFTSRHLLFSQDLWAVNLGRNHQYFCTDVNIK